MTEEQTMTGQYRRRRSVIISSSLLIVADSHNRLMSSGRLRWVVYASVKGDNEMIYTKGRWGLDGVFLLRHTAPSAKKTDSDESASLDFDCWAQGQTAIPLSQKVR